MMPIANSKRAGDAIAWLALGRTTLTCLAFNTAQVYRLQAGERLASLAIRRLRHRQRELGSAPAARYVAGCYGVFSLEELLDALGAAPRESLLPNSFLQISAGASEKCKKFVKSM
jgi:hypothetical protein